MSELDRFSHQLMIIVGIFMYILGFIGNLLNICVFTRWSFFSGTANEHRGNNRTGNSSLYLLTTSMANFILIIYPLLIRILVDGYQQSVIDSNVIVLCKLRYYVLQTSLIVSLICTCLATFDRYLITSRTVHLRQMSPTRSSTKKIILAIVLLSALHSVPIAIYYDKSITGDCVIVSVIYSNYYLYFVIVALYGILPICFLLVFGSLTYKHLQTLKRTQNGNAIADQHLSEMVLFQCLALVFSYIPYCVQHIYFAKFVNKNAPPTSFNLLFRIITIILFYVNPVASFYIFYISTANFRRQIRKILSCRKHHRQGTNNRVHTFTVEHDLR